MLTLRHSGDVSRVCFSLDGNRVAGEGAQAVHVWDPMSGIEVLQLKGRPSFVRNVCFSPDGRRLSGSGDSIVRVWDGTSGEELLQLKGHTSWMHGVAFSPDNRWLASASEDKTVRVWDVDTGAELLRLEGHTSAVTSVCFSPKGERLASQASQQMRIWDLATGACLHVRQGTNNKDMRAFASGGGEAFQARSNNLELVVEHASTGRLITCFAESPRQSLTPSPTGHAWAWGMSHHLYLVALEDTPDG